MAILKQHTPSLVKRGFSATRLYMFGFNGQEKDDEVYNVTGSSYTATFWQYDSRLGRRWNLDPVYKEWESPFATFSNNPLYLIDPNGDNAWHPVTDDDGNTNLVADAGDDYGTLQTYLDEIGVQRTDEDNAELASQFNSVLEIHPLPSTNSIEGLTLTSSSGLFDNLVGTYLVNKSSKVAGNWAFRDGAQGGCSPTLANRTAIAVKYVYGEKSEEYRKLNRGNIFEGFIGYSLFQNAYVGHFDRINNKKYGEGGIYAYGVTDEMINSSIAGALMYSGTGYRVDRIEDLKPGAIVGFGYHTAIYLSTERDTKGNVIGIRYWDQHGIYKTSETGWEFNIGGNFK